MFVKEKSKEFLTGKNEGQVIFTIGSFFLGLLTIAFFMVASLNGANAAENAVYFSDSAKLLISLIPVAFLIAVFMLWVNSNN